MSYVDLPEWAWDLIDALVQYEDEHPMLYRQASDGSYEREPCAGSALLRHIPSDVLDLAATMRERARRRDPWIKECAWDEGWAAHAEQHMQQRADPERPITCENPYREVPF